jgi:hypothetical protein
MASLAYAGEPVQRPYEEVFALWNASVKAEIYAGHSVIYGDSKLLEELQRRAPENKSFLKAEVPKYFFAPIILSKTVGGDTGPRKPDGKQVVIARYTEAEDKAHHAGRAGALLFFHNILGGYSHVDNDEVTSLSIPEEKAAEARKLIQEGMKRGEFTITLLPTNESAPEMRGAAERPRGE